MAIKPSPTIAGKLRKLFSNNKQTIEPAIGDSIPGGSGGGANVLTLYAGKKDDADWAYKNPECTEEYATFEEAVDAVNNASSIRVIMQPELGTQGTFFSNGFIVTDEIEKAVNVGVLIGRLGSTTPYSYTLFEEFGQIM